MCWSSHLKRTEKAMANNFRCPRCNCIINCNRVNEFGGSEFYTPTHCSNCGTALTGISLIPLETQVCPLGYCVQCWIKGTNPLPEMKYVRREDSGGKMYIDDEDFGFTPYKTWDVYRCPNCGNEDKRDTSPRGRPESWGIM